MRSGAFTVRDINSNKMSVGVMDDGSLGIRVEDKDGALLSMSGMGGESIVELIYPVGSIYISTVNTNPSILFSIGTWVAFGSGRTLVGVDTGQTEFDTVEETGGAKTHTLTVTEMPSHQHGQVVTHDGTGGVRRDYNSDGGASAYDQGVNTYATGGGGAHNNLQPYITVYFWKRTA
jgi:hypothetical protein